MITLGVFDHIDDNYRTLSELYAERLELAAACDRAGFYAYQVSEHHGTPHGHTPSPNLFLAAMAQRTRRLRLGPLVMLLNLYHPLRAFEEVCMLDQISGGRVEVGLGSGGSPIEPGFFGIAVDEARERYRECMGIVLKAMEVNRLSHDGPYFHLDDVPITLAPAQRPRPPLWHATMNAEGAAWAAEHGFNLASAGTTANVREITGAYHAHRRADAAGPAPMVGMVRQIVVADSEMEARALAAPAYERWFETLHYLLRTRGHSTTMLAPPSFEAAVEEGFSIVGTPRQVRETLLRQAAETDVNYVLCQLAFGNLPLSASLATVEALRSEVMPHLRRPLQ